MGWGHGKVKVGHHISPRSEFQSKYRPSVGATCARMCNESQMIVLFNEYGTKKGTKKLHFISMAF